MKINLIIPCFNERHILPKLIDTLENILFDLIQFDFIFVDDGSTDGTWKFLSEQACLDAKIKAIRLSKNFGKEAAICAGLENADGDAAIILDADLQHPPDIIPQMIELWQSGYDIVDGIKKSRGKESCFYKISAKLFYHIFKKLSQQNLENASDFKLLDRKVILGWNQFTEKDTFFRGLSAWMGFKRTSIEFEVQERSEGSSKWSLRKLIHLSLVAITGFSAKPLLIIPLITFITGFIFFILGIQTFINWLVGNAVEGFTTVILLILFIGFSIMLSLSLLALYLAEIFNEIKNRPRFFIAEKINLNDSNTNTKKTKSQ